MKAIPITLCACLMAAGCVSTNPIAPQVASAAVDFRAAKVVDIRLANFSFAPPMIDLEAGRPYLLKIENTASGSHDFSAPEFFAAARLAPEDAARLTSGQLDLKAHETVIVRLVPATGTYKLACTHFGHAMLGMTGRIIVH